MTSNKKSDYENVLKRNLLSTIGITVCIEKPDTISVETCIYSWEYQNTNLLQSLEDYSVSNNLKHNFE